MSSQEICLGLDIGGTKFACVATTTASLINSSFFNKPTIPTLASDDHGYKVLTGPLFSVDSFDKVLDEFILKLSETYYENYKIVSIGVAICGLSDKEGTITLCEIGILQGWNPVKHLKEKFGQDVKVLTFMDSVAALEHARREWPDIKDLSIMVAGTGIGAAFLCNGQIVRGHLNAAGNVGIAPVFLPQDYTKHVKNDITEPMGSTLSPPPPTMMLDQLAGGRALIRIITQEIGVSVEEAIQRLSKYSSPKEVFSNTSDDDVEIDQKLLKIILDWATVFGIAMANILCIFNPKVLVIAGGVLNFPFYVDRVMEIGQEYAGAIIPEIWSETLVVRSYWSNDLIVRGALAAAYDDGKYSFMKNCVG
ncbi:17790_t:CDS:2 [Funneliformis geosporum]|uniref:13002_t:CDS:1 n=1 Tax=Funneliformis geosporum TaxID=1117311 RepID=A0A9W4SSM5_9GLOM|nr:17790_t:CDS:2 [Funneliformis geosporum]CAI2179376.1 13002_t:CDS:2 [Funneliformis geosporum]